MGPWQWAANLDLKDAIVMAFGILGMLWYYTCLIVIGFQTSKAPETALFRQFMSLSITTIGVALATFVGMLLGFRGVSDEIRKGVTQVTTTTAHADGTPAGLNPQARPGLQKLQEVVRAAEGSALQWWASGLYAFSIALALFCWWYRGDTVTDPAIVNLGKSLLGLVAGSLSVILSLPHA